MRKRKNPTGLGPRGHVFGLPPHEKRKGVALSVIMGKLRQKERITAARLESVRKFIQAIKLEKNRIPTRNELIERFPFLDALLPKIKR